MYPRARYAAPLRSRAPGIARFALAALLLAFLAVEFVPCIGAVAPGVPSSAAGPAIMMLRVCGGADLGPGSIADRPILLSEAASFVPSAPSRVLDREPRPVIAEGHRMTVFRPPRGVA